MSLKDRLSSLSDRQTAVIYLGQAGFLLSHGGMTVLVDPYLSYSVDKAVEKGDGMWTRRYAPPYTPEELSFADYVFLSHDHLDHADPETVFALSACSEAEFVCSAAIADKICSYGASRVLSVKEGFPLECGAFSVRLLPAAHEQIHRDGNGDCAECGFLFDFDGVWVYHAGDSLVYDGLCEAVSGADVMLLPVHGNGFFRRADDIVGHTGAYDAARLASAASAKLLIPMHFDLYAGNSVPASAVGDIISAAAPGLDFRLPEPGKGWVITPRNTKITVEDFR